ncbi:MAG: methionyl aminopeptidase [Sphingobacteriales bacterium]|jgi:methionyl aminopeptidase
MIHYKSPEEIELLRESSLLVGKTHAEVARHIKPGVSTLYLDKIAETFIRDHGAEPGFLNYGGFPNSLCMSVNERVVHGIPTNKELVDGDIVSVDCGVLLNGYYGDSAYTYAVGDVSEDVKRLMSVTRESLYKGIEQAVEGNRMGDISSAVQEHAQAAGFSVVRELVGHGVGKNLHEKPEVPNYGKKGSGLKLRKGLVIAIEPMINMGTKSIVQLQDGWTIITKDRKPSAHYEHMIAITDDKPDILSSFEEIEKVLKEQNLYVH